MKRGLARPLLAPELARRLRAGEERWPLARELTTRWLDLGATGLTERPRGSAPRMVGDWIALHAAAREGERGAFAGQHVFWAPEGDHGVVFSENQGNVRYAVALEDVPLEDPPVHIEVAPRRWESAGVTLSELTLQIALACLVTAGGAGVVAWTDGADACLRLYERMEALPIAPWRGFSLDQRCTFGVIEDALGVLVDDGACSWMHVIVPDRAALGAWLARVGMTEVGFEIVEPRPVPA